MNLQELINEKGWDTNGYSHFNLDNYENKSGYCYVSENAEIIEDALTYDNMIQLIAEFSPSYITKNEAEHIIDLFFEAIEDRWEFFETFLSDYFTYIGEVEI